MVGGRHAETYRGGGKKGAKCKDIGTVGGGVAGRKHLVDVDANKSEEEGTKQVRVDVDGLVVEVAKRGEGFAEGECCRPGRGECQL